MELELKVLPRKFDLVDRSVESPTCAEQLRYLWWDTTRYLVGEVLQFCIEEAREKLQLDDTGLCPAGGFQRSHN
jgi:hypothetical protein